MYGQRLRWIAGMPSRMGRQGCHRAGVSVNNVHVVPVTKRRIVAANASESRVIIAAEHTMALLLALTRNIPHTPSRWLPETLRTEGRPNAAALVMFRSEPVTEHPSAPRARSPQLSRRPSECAAPSSFQRRGFGQAMPMSHDRRAVQLGYRHPRLDTTASQAAARHPYPTACYLRPAFVERCGPKVRHLR
jgi:hypothetical protein